MSKYIATVIKSGNSYALRVPKAYVEETGLRLGQKVEMAGAVVPLRPHDPAAIRRAIRRLQAVGAYREISDPVAWQREQRQDRPLPGRTDI